MREDGAKVFAVLGHAGSAELTQANSMAMAHTIESNGARRIGLGECAAGNGHPSQFTHGFDPFLFAVGDQRRSI